MSNEFLRSYTIPLVDPNAVEQSQPPLYIPLESENQIPVLTSNDRYFAPGKQEPGGQIVPNITPPRPPKRKYPIDTNGSEINFFGRDPSYPEELKKLIQPLLCELCNVKLNSPKSARSHYESKAHDRKLTAWIAQNYPENPPEIKRFFHVPNDSIGGEILHCNLCDLPLTSQAHAKQHYSGRKHKLVASNVSNPSGAGYYDAEGKWKRTGTKLTPVVANDGRFGIGAAFKASEEVAITDNLATSTVELAEEKTTNPATQDESLFCKICKAAVTSAAQMKTHLEGARHRKNLARLSVDPNADISNINGNDTLMKCITSENKAGVDYSTYRTPSGSYYCQNCNVSLSSVTVLEQHMQGKKHLKQVNEQKLAQLKSNKPKIV